MTEPVFTYDLQFLNGQRGRVQCNRATIELIAKACGFLCFALVTETIDRKEQEAYWHQSQSDHG